MANSCQSSLPLPVKCLPPQLFFFFFFAQIVPDHRNSRRGLLNSSRVHITSLHKTLVQSEPCRSKGICVGRGSRLTSQGWSRPRKIRYVHLPLVAPLAGTDLNPGLEEILTSNSTNRHPPGLGGKLREPRRSAGGRAELGLQFCTRVYGRQLRGREGGLRIYSS